MLSGDDAYLLAVTHQLGPNGKDPLALLEPLGYGYPVAVNAPEFYIFTLRAGFAVALLYSKYRVALRCVRGPYLGK